MTKNHSHATQSSWPGTEDDILVTRLTTKDENTTLFCYRIPLAKRLCKGSFISLAARPRP